MDSTAEETRKRERQTTPSAGGDGDDVDRISGLNDDVLLHILGLVGDASDAARTGTLSRRWLGLWTRAPALSFASPSVLGKSSLAEQSDADALKQFVSSVNGALALRTAPIERLAISYSTDSGNDMPASVDPNCSMPNNHRFLRCFDGERDAERLMPASVDAMQGWIRYALRHEVRSLSMNVRLRHFWSGHDANHWHNDEEERRRTGKEKEKPAVFLGDVDVLPSPAKRLEAMQLALGGAVLRLPAAAMKLALLTDLALEWIKMEAGSVHLLAQLLSSVSCPLLRKLRMRRLSLDAHNEEMLLQADMLSELWIEDVRFLLSLKIRTPSLKVFQLYQPWHQRLTASAPRLEELEVSFPQVFPGSSPPRWLDVDGDFPCVRSLKLCMKSHSPPGYDGDANATDTNVQILKHCSSLRCLEVTLTGPVIPTGPEPYKWHMDIIKSRVPHLPHITSLTMNISRRLGRHAYGASVASLLTRFNNLRRLSMHLPFYKRLDEISACNHQHHWKCNKFSMAHLREVELIGLTGTDCEFWFIKAVIARATRLQKVAISFNPNCWQHEGKMDVFECILLEEGMWTFHRDMFMLSCVKHGLI